MARGTMTAVTEPTADAIAAFRPETASAADVEQLIDYRVAKIDAEIKEHLAHVEDLREERKRWVGVTGGRSRVKAEEGDDGRPTG